MNYIQYGKLYYNFGAHSGLSIHNPFIQSSLRMNMSLVFPVYRSLLAATRYGRQTSTYSLVSENPLFCERLYLLSCAITLRTPGRCPGKTLQQVSLVHTTFRSESIYFYLSSNVLVL